MSDSNSSADIVACVAVLVAVISISVNFHQWKEIERLQNTADRQALRIQTMERTLLMTR